MLISNGPAILYPMFALVALTACVQLLIPIVRVHSARKGEVRLDDFKHGESAAVPGAVRLPNRNYMNLLEFPALLYPACLLAYVATAVTPAMVTLAWTFVALRCVHTAIHLTYNNVVQRATVFGLSNAALLALWIVVGLALGRPGA